MIIWTAVVGLVKTVFDGWSKKAEAKAQVKADQIAASGQADVEATKQMRYSWKDEYWLILFSTPLIGMFASPYIDVIVALTQGSLDYVPGMLLLASTQALINLEQAPLWYRAIIIMMVAVSYGYRKLISWYLMRNK